MIAQVLSQVLLRQGREIIGVIDDIAEDLEGTAIVDALTGTVVSGNPTAESGLEPKVSELDSQFIDLIVAHVMTSEECGVAESCDEPVENGLLCHLVLIVTHFWLASLWDRKAVTQEG